MLACNKTNGDGKTESLHQNLCAYYNRPSKLELCGVTLGYNKVLAQVTDCQKSYTPLRIKNFISAEGSRQHEQLEGRGNGFLMNPQN